MREFTAGSPPNQGLFLPPHWIILSVLMDVPDRVGWMKQHRRYNIAVTGEGFSDTRLAEFFEEEPVWNVAPVMPFTELLRLLGFVALRASMPKEFEGGFKEYRVTEGSVPYVFRVWNPSRQKAPAPPPKTENVAVPDNQN